MLSTIGTMGKGRVENVSVCSLQTLQDRLIQFSFFNLFLVALLGVLLRAFPFLGSFPFSYKNVLHGHSHFAFGGWVMPILLALVIKYFPVISQKVGYRHWRNIAVLLFFSAYGMLVSFPIQGYKAVSIFFSTLSVAAGYYLAIVIWMALRNEAKTTGTRFLQWGLVYLSLSAIGPFATGPLIVLGYQGSPLYYNAIYYYLHFQYSGWFTFAVLAVLYQLIGLGSSGNSKKVFVLLNAACVPTFFLSVLWNKPGLIFNVIGGLGALLQLVALYFLLKDLVAYKKRAALGGLFTLSLVAFCLKLVLQQLSAFTVFASMAYQYRNFVIAYLHLVLLGFITLFVFSAIFKAYPIKQNGWLERGVLFFLLSFVATEFLLVLHAWGGKVGFAIPGYTQLLLAGSIGFPIGVLMAYSQIHGCNTDSQRLLQKSWVTK
jgi:hypothetical protein